MSLDVSKILRERIRSLRDAKGLTQEELEEIIGRPSPNYISRIETGRFDPPLDVIGDIAEGLGVPLNSLFSTEDLDETIEDIRMKIHRLADVNDLGKLRTYYRLMLAVTED